jgi:hypothetical protein
MVLLFQFKDSYIQTFLQWKPIVTFVLLMYENGRIRPLRTTALPLFSLGYQTKLAKSRTHDLCFPFREMLGKVDTEGFLMNGCTSPCSSFSASIFCSDGNLSLRMTLREGKNTTFELSPKILRQKLSGFSWSVGDEDHPSLFRSQKWVPN